MLIERLKEKYQVNEPIFTNEILEIFSEYSRAYIFRLIDLAEKMEKLLSFMLVYIIYQQKILLVFQQ